MVTEDRALPQETAPQYVNEYNFDAPESSLLLQAQAISDDTACSLVRQTFERVSQWRTNNHDQRWRLNDWLYYGFVPPRVYEGTSIPRPNIPVQVAFDQVETAHARLCNELLMNDEILGVFPTGDSDLKVARQVRDRLLYLIDHNIDDYGWTARMEFKLALKDMLIYGNCFGIVEYDGTRRQSTIVRVDPRDVYVDSGTTSPYVERARSTILRRQMPLSDIVAMKDFPDFRIPADTILIFLARNRPNQAADQTKAAQELARGIRFNPGGDDWLPNPSDRFIDVFVYQGGGREVWTLNNLVTIYNEAYPYSCSRLVSAPAFIVPNRFYAQSLVDVVDPIQQTETTLLNWHLEEMAMAMRPPRVAKTGTLRGPGAYSWRPNALIETANPKEDLIVHPPQGITSTVWQSLEYLDEQASRRSGISSMAMSGMAQPSNGNRTAGGMQMQAAGTNERLSMLAANFEDYFMTPAFYKMLKVEARHRQGVLYGKRG